MSYNEKHNEANGEDNNDGESHNRSWNHGVEGPTDDPEILEARAREQRNFIATLLLSQGVPMLLHGDELSRTQDGNNNTYAQDSEIGWVHWDHADKPLIEFTAAVAKLRAEPPDVPPQALLHRQHRAHRRRRAPQRHRLARPRRRRRWRTSDWEGAKAIGMYLNGDGIAGKDARGGAITDDHFLLYFNADGPADGDPAARGVRRRVGRGHRHRRRRRRRCTTFEAGATFHLETHSLVVLREHAEAEASRTTRSPRPWPRSPTWAT